MSNMINYSRRYGCANEMNPFSQDILREFKDKLELTD